MGIPDHLTCLLRNLYAGQEAAVRTGHGITDWFQIRKGIHQGCILSSCLFNLYAEFSSVQSLSRVRLFVTPWTPGMPGLPFHQGTYAEDIMRNAGLDEAQAGIKIAGRNINNLNMQMTTPLWQKAKN